MLKDDSKLHARGLSSHTSRLSWGGSQAARSAELSVALVSDAAADPRQEGQLRVREGSADV